MRMAPMYLLFVGLVLVASGAGRLLAADLDSDGVADGVDVCCNTPVGVAVDVEGRPVGDLDEDCDVDLFDFAILASNLTGPLAPVPCPSCSDSQMNGDETDVDCGGGDCPPCTDGLMCAAGSDCQSGVCQGGICVAPSCTDFIKNGSETDVDCGGSCPACADGLMCVAGSDCQSFVCQGGFCHSPTCNDGVQNGSETGIDCGGPCLACPQPNGAACSNPAECQSNFCIDGFCCNTSCAGNCLACDVSGSIGACTPIPVGMDPDNECSGSMVCDGLMNCKSIQGSPCGSPLQCLSGFCADGRCCNEPCTGTCESCDQSGFVGSCEFIPDGEDPDDECSFLLSCDGAGGCG